VPNVDAKEVLSEPWNMKTNPVKRGPAIENTLFGKCSYNAIGDPFKEAALKIVMKEHR